LSASKYRLPEEKKKEKEKAKPCNPLSCLMKMNNKVKGTPRLCNSCLSVRVISTK
jgi:hypothetical protein